MKRKAEPTTYFVTRVPSWPGRLLKGILGLRPLSLPLWLLRRTLAQYLLAAAVAAVAFVGVKYALPTAADIALVVYARAREGTPAHVDIGYVRTEIMDDYGVAVNSEWVMDYMTRIVPFFSYERLSNLGIYPEAVMVVPYFRDRSFVIAGEAGATPDGTLVIRLNERAALEPSWTEADLLVTLTHELLHHQGPPFGARDYAHPADEEFTQEASIRHESHTVAGTLEVVAAMCQYGDPLACQAFWGEIRSLASVDLWQRFQDLGAPWLHELVMDAVGRSAIERQRADKSDRYYDLAIGGQEARAEIRSKYAVLPWRELILPALRGRWMSAGTNLMVGEWEGRQVFLMAGFITPFDDTIATMGPFVHLLSLATGW